MNAQLYNALPKALRTKELRAEQMIVSFCECGCSVYTVYEPDPNDPNKPVRGSKKHSVTQALQCTCDYAKFNHPTCAHVLAARRYPREEKPVYLRAKIPTTSFPRGH